jgi:hypothetical protein
MTMCRTVLLAALIVATPLCANAQIGGGQGDPPDGLGTAPSPPLACQQLFALRDDVHKHGMAIQKANERKATVQEACKLFTTFLTAEAQYIRQLGDNSRTCGVPPFMVKQANAGHARASQVGEQVCDATGQGPRPAGPKGDFWWLGEVEPKSGQFYD